MDACRNRDGAFLFRPDIVLNTIYYILYINDKRVGVDLVCTMYVYYNMNVERIK